MTPLPIPQTVLPDPNGWDDFVEAGKMAENSKELRTISFFDTVPQTQLSTAVKVMAPVYKRLEIGLGKQARWPVDYNSFDIDVDVFSSMRTLARALAAQSRLAKMEGRFEEAANASLEGIHFGYALRRGGLISDMLVSSACSGIGRYAMYGVREELSASHCLRLIAELGGLEREAEPIKDVFHRDRVWTKHAFGWQGHLWQILDDVDPWGSHGSLESAYDRERAEMRLLRLELAIQAWRKTHGSLPESLGELVPQIIDEIPVDPFDLDGGLLKYRRTEEGYVLYSVGPNGIDDGGVAPDEEDDIAAFETGDLRLDIRYAPEPEAVEDEEIEDERETESVQQ